MVGAVPISSDALTIKDVAREAGVSTGTVSRVLNKRAGVRHETRETVLATVERLDYRPDVAARELSSRQATRVGLSISKASRRLTPFFMLFLEHIIAELQTGGYRVEEVPTRSDGLPERLSDAVVLFGAHADDPRVRYLQDKDIPFVLVGHQKNVRYIMPDDFDGGLQATNHLLRLGHREIVHVGGPKHAQVAFDRRSGYSAALEGAGLKENASFVLDGDFSSLAAYRALRAAYARGLRFSAVFAASDEMALGVLAALEDLGLNVPGDVSVVGFDDLPEIGEGLTTVRQDIGDIAARAVKLLKEGLRDEPVRHEVVQVNLIVRGTTARKR
ncbi:LacI family DNA-binding transcriptional regulator [soil metagenome]